MAELTEEELTARHVARLCAFVVRLRRVEGHALVRDKKFVQQVAEGTFQVTVTEGEGAASIRSVLPESEELLESATARVRPLVLKTEPTHGLSAIGALRYLLRGQDGFAEGGQYRPYLDSLKEGWKELEADYRSPLSAFTVMRVDAGTSESLSFEDLAWAWVYGDVVHAYQERRDQTQGFGVRARYEAGAILTCKIILQAIATLNFIRQAREKGWLELPDECFDEQVTVGDAPFVRSARVFAAEHDGDIPVLPSSPEDALDEQFSELSAGELRRLIEGGSDEETGVSTDQ